MRSSLDRRRLSPTGPTTGSTIGSTMVELTVAIAIVGVAILVMLQQISLSHHEAGVSKDKVFAYQKALGMLAELQVGIGRGEIGDTAALEARADLQPNPVLTTLRPDGVELAADHPMSGNLRRDGEWVWARRLSVSSQPGARDLRRVGIEVLRRPDGGGTPRVAAAVSALLGVSEAASPSVQEYDLFALALAAVPSTILPPAGVRSTLDAAVASLEERSPGLRFRVHWITELGYGRDPLYVPFVNTYERAVDAAPFAYWYPGRVDEVSPSLFSPELFGGLVRTEAGVQNGYDPGTNPYPFAVADRFNHAAREPAARALFERRVAAGLADPNEPPLQLLLADMHAQPDRFRNAILINLHGDVLPFPPLRNHADAARDPDAHPGVRVVTHPAHLRPERDPNGDGIHTDTQDLELRVYAYKVRPSDGPAVLGAPITVRILGVDLTGNVNGIESTATSTLEVRRLAGGVDVDDGSTSGTGYTSFDGPGGLPPTVAARAHPFEMAIEWGFASTPEPHTWIRLFGTPLTAPPVDGRGLDADQRLYSMEYVPSPVAVAGGPSGDFPIDLATIGSGPKNTARWRIRIPAAVFEPGFPGGGLPDVDRRLTIETVLGDDPLAGTVWPVPIRPLARSVTYAWWARSPEFVPLTERYQVLGDPRLNPYADLVAGGRSYAHGYSWYFDDLRDGTDDVTGSWPCLDAARLRDGFAGVQADVPRIAQVWREALLASSGFFTQHGGRLCGAVGFGGEVCLPAEPGTLGPRPLSVAGVWYGAGGTLSVDQLTQDLLSASTGLSAPGGGGGGALRRGQSVVRASSGAFWSKPWLGELAPDDAFGDWSVLGNLPTGIGPARFGHVGIGDVDWPDLPRGTSFDEPFGAILDERGAATLVASGVPSARFRQLVAAPGTSIAPDLAPRELFQALGVGRPIEEPGLLSYGFAEALDAPLPQQGFGEYVPHFAQELERFAVGPAQRSASGVVRVLAPDGIRSAFLVIDGGTPVTAPAQLDAVRAAVGHGLRAFHIAGHPALDTSVEQLPRLLLLAPENGLRMLDPVALELHLRVAFERFDVSPYTVTYPPQFEGSERDLGYLVLASADDGLTWTDARSGQVVDLGAPWDPALVMSDSGPGDETILVETPVTSFPDGEYRFRVVVTNARRAVHRSWHEVRVRIERSGGGVPR